MAWYRDPKRPDRNNDGFLDIQYPTLARLFLQDVDQKLVPFLGAGASLSAPAPSSPPADPIDREVLSRLVEQLGLRNEISQLAFEIGVAVAQRLERSLPATPAPRPRAFENAQSQAYPPSAAQLAQTFTELSGYDYFLRARNRIAALTGRMDWDNDKLNDVLRALANLTGVGSDTPDLLDAASYYEHTSDRDPLFTTLKAIFANKHEPTETHRLVAKAAGAYLARRPAGSRPADYLTITTNYDCLLETAFDKAEPPVPYFVLTVSRKGLATSVTFSKSCESYLGVDSATLRSEEQEASKKVPSNYEGPQYRIKSLAVVYKIHGDPAPDKKQEEPDNIVITDEDYVDFISLNGKNNAIPGGVRTLLHKKGLLLLGYSFGDWNVRSLYKAMVENRAALPIGIGDYAVLKDPNPYETGFFNSKKINILDTPLDLFCQRMQEQL